MSDECPAGEQSHLHIGRDICCCKAAQLSLEQWNVSWWEAGGVCPRANANLLKMSRGQTEKMWAGRGLDWWLIAEWGQRTHLTAKWFITRMGTQRQTPPGHTSRIHSGWSRVPAVQLQCQGTSRSPCVSFRQNTLTLNRTGCFQNLNCFEVGSDSNSSSLSQRTIMPVLCFETRQLL